ncbi:ribosomal-protein-alanine N-acetyltransferase [Candidatus Endobugula sertula]|uniref:[Ribosomal protein bS18]-alanine N-acetyltransferase n=1 Tax=Candidatus Endobugula sertula TaxID=62101 RepID=A0A1D2QNS3_9GAMM|nr:ribosomal-protein-alanine N-acetyltransferase [Candidatus Endobugula sertula]
MVRWLHHRQHDYQLRAMSSDDLDSVLTLEEEAQRYPWSRADFDASLNSFHQCWVLQSDQHLVAYAITSTAADEADLLNITVARGYQRQGLGRLLLKAISQSFHSSIQTLFLEVRASNHGAIALYHQLNFNELGIRPNYYPAKKGREDAIIMGLSLCG